MPVGKVSLILANANVITLDPAQPRAAAVAVSGERIAAVGSSASISRLAPDDAEVVDCQGLTLLPGFNDAHCHLPGLARRLIDLDCSPQRAPSIRDLQALIRAKAESRPPGAWIRGFGYDHLQLAEGRHPSRQDMDAAAPGHPVWLDHRSGHAAALNGPALALASMVALAVLAINLYFMPAGLRVFKDRQFEIRHSLASLLLQEGVFNTPVDGLTVFVRERTLDGELRGILVHDNRETESAPVTVTAERGALLNTADHPRFVLENGNRQQVDRDSNRLSVLYFESYAFDFAPQTGLLPGRIRKPKERYLAELIRPEEEVAAYRRAEFLAEAWQRVSSPFHAVILALIACAALLSGDFNRRGQVRRAFAGGAIGVVFLSASLGVQNMIAANPQLAVVHGLALVLCGVAAAATLLLERKRRWTLAPAPSD